MKIIFVNEFFPPYVTGGTEIFLENLAKYLKSKGHEIVVITSDQGQPDNPDFKVYKIKSSPFHVSHRYQFSGFTLPWMFFNKSLNKKINKIYEKEKPDLLYINNMFHLSFSPLKNIPFILDVHDYWPICFSKDLYYNKKCCTSKNPLKCSRCLASKSKIPIYLLSSPLLALEQYLTKSRLSRSKKIICHSKFVQEKLKLNNYQSTVIPYPYMGSMKPKVNKNPVFKILFVGRIEERKGAKIILNTAKYLKGKLKFTIDVIGTGPLKKILDRPDLNINLHGFMGDERFKFFEKSDCLLVPSKWPEPFGIVALEAMASTTPIITLKNSGLAEIVEQNKSGVVLDEYEIPEKILYLAKNPKKMQEIRHNQGKNIKMYNKEKIYREYEDIFMKNIK